MCSVWASAGAGVADADGSAGSAVAAVAAEDGCDDDDDADVGWSPAPFAGGACDDPLLACFVSSALARSTMR